MQNKRIAIDAESDISAILAKLRRDCVSAGLSLPETNELIVVIQESIDSMIQNGKAVAQAGGRFSATRIFKTDKMNVSLVASFGFSSGFLIRFRKMFFGE